MIQKPSRKTTRAGQTATVAAAAMLVAPGLLWGIAVIVHLYRLRRGLDACFADD
jgi:hypothetical protein